MFLFRVFLHATAEGSGITHVVHAALQPDTYHTTALANGLEGRGEFYLADVVTFNLTLHDVLMQLGEDLWGKDILTKDAVVLFLTIFVSDTEEILCIAGLGFLDHRTDIEYRAVLVFPYTV